MITPRIRAKYIDLDFTLEETKALGGPGSGNFGHAGGEGGPGNPGGSTSSGGGEKWTPGGNTAVVAAASKVLEKAGIKLSTTGKAQYTHTGQMHGGGAKSSRGITIEKAGSSTRLSYTYGSSWNISDKDMESAAAEVNRARDLLHAAGFETRELSFLKNTYEVQKPPKQQSLTRRLKALAHDTRPPRKRTRFLVGVKFKP